MKIGTIRRIDDLGRIVLPKSIRNSLRIKSGDNLEVFVSENDIILRKYSELNKVAEIGNNIVEILKENLGALVLICDKDKFICSSSPLREKYLDMDISDELLEIIQNRQAFMSDSGLFLKKDSMESGNIIVNPIIINGDVLGAIIVLSSSKFSESNLQVINILTKFLIKNIE